MSVFCQKANLRETSTIVGGESQEYLASRTNSFVSAVEEIIVLPRADGGLQAWACVFGASMVEGLMWGFALTSGVFQLYYQQNNTFANAQHVSLVGTLTIGIAYLDTLNIRNQMIWGGWATCVLALISSSFATQIWHLVLTQGVLYGLGYLVIYYPVLNILNEWFIERRGLAYSIMFGSAGVFGIGLPFLVETLLNHYGHATTLRVFGVAIILLVGPTLPLIRHRIPNQANELAERNIVWRVFNDPLVFVITGSNILQGLVFFLPSLYLPCLSADQGIMLLSILNVSQIFGQIGIGYLSDYSGPLGPMVGSTFFSLLVMFCGWNFSKGFGPLISFCILYGLFAGGYSVLYCRFVTLVTKYPATGLWLYSVFELQRGIGNLVGGSVSGVLTKDSLGKPNYQGLVYFAGVAMLLSCLCGSSYLLLGNYRPRFQSRFFTLT